MPATSVYRQAIAAVVAQLSGISVANGFNVDVQKVYDYDITPSEDLAYDIFIGVNERSLIITANFMKLTPAYDCRYTLPVGIRALIRTTSDKVNDVRRQLTDDIAQALYTRQPPSGGGGGLFFLGIPGTLFETSIEFQQLSSDVLAASGLAGLYASFNLGWLGDPTNNSLQ